MTEVLEFAEKRVLRDLDSFCRHEHGRLVGMLGLYLGDRHQAEDLAQEALARACRHWPELEGMEHPERWLTRVAFNLAKSSFRSRSARRRITERFGTSMASSPAPPDATDALAVRAAVAQLPERQRRALILRYFADLPVAEVATLMNCPPGTVKTLTYQGIASLRRSGLEVTDA